MRRKFNIPTSYDVASRAGVSQAVVSRAFQPGAPIAAATRAKVLQAAQALGYQPNTVARSLITKRSGLVAILISQDTQRETSEVLFSLSLALQRKGFQPLLFTVAQESEADLALARATAHGVDAVVSCLELTEAALARAWQRPCPVVMFNREAPVALASSVATDNRGASRLLASRLYAAGHRRYALVGGPPDAPVARLREAGFCERLAELGVTHVQHFQGDYHYESGHAAGLQLLQVPDPALRAEVIFCVNDAMALGVLDAARFALMLQVPRDVSIVGFDNIPAGQRPAYQLTTVSQPFDKLADQVGNAVCARLADHGTCTRTQLPAELVERASALLFPRVVPAP
jgi:DNA-binding LacI/PurR family transcriptional regulator